ncbi:MAG: hypothetical protein ACT4PP_00970 [Sporichthyaceae bacterium]
MAKTLELPVAVLALSAQEAMARSLAELVTAVCAPGNEVRAKAAAESCREAAGSTRAAGRLEPVIDALTSGADPRPWHGALLDSFEEVSATRRAMLLADLCLHHPHVEAAALVSGAVLRRLDLVLDLGQCPFAAHDVQTRFAAIAQDLGEAKLTRASASAITAFRLTLGAAGVGLLGNITGDKLRTLLTAPDDQVNTLSRLLVGMWAGGSTEEIETASVAAAWDAVAQAAAEASEALAAARRGNSGQGKADRVHRVACCAAEFGQGLAEQFAPELLPARIVAPVTDLAFDEAHRVLDALGYQVKGTDALANRWVTKKNNWKVVEQQPPGEQHEIALGLRKFDDPS